MVSLALCHRYHIRHICIDIYFQRYDVRSRHTRVDSQIYIEESREDATCQSSLPDSYALDYRRVLKAYPQTKQLQWSNFRAHPYYTLNDGQNELYIDASDTLIRPLQLTEKEIRKAVESVYLAKNKDGHSSEKRVKAKTLYLQKNKTEKRI